MKKLFMVMLLAFASISGVFAQEIDENATRSYATGEGWFVQAQGGMHFNAAENAKFVPVSKWISYNTSLSVGKRFTTLWGIRAQFMYGGDNGFFESKKDSQVYNFNHFAGYLEMTLNLTNAFRGGVNVGEEKPFNLYLIAGPGCTNTFNFDKKGYMGNTSLTGETQTAFTFYGALEAAYSFCPHFDVNLEIGGSCQSDNFNGVDCESYLELAGSVMLGVRYTF